MTVVVASKRGPVEYEDVRGGGLAARPVLGGVANALLDPLLPDGSVWVASATSDGDHVAAEREPAGSEVEITPGRTIRVRLLRHPREVDASVQDQLSSDILWAATNYLWDRSTAPTFDAATRLAWDRLGQFSRTYAEALAEEGGTSPRYLLHDYQMVLMPPLLRAARPDSAILVYIHTSWPEPDYYRILPSRPRREAIEGMLGADVVAFLAQRWARNWLRCVEDLVPDAAVDAARGIVRHGGGCTHAAVIPLGYSSEISRRHPPRRLDELDRWVGGEPLVVHYGRTNANKNADRAVMAFVLAVERDERLAGARMLVRASPHHLHVARNRDYLTRVEAAVSAANRRLGCEAVRFVSENDTAATLGTYARADLLIANSTVDGQNLCPFEATLASRRDIDVVLSENCGAAEILGRLCRVVNPFDLEQQAEAIHAALTAPREERRRTAAERRVVARAYTSGRWLETQLETLAAAAEDPPPRAAPIPAGEGAPA